MERNSEKRDAALQDVENVVVVGSGPAGWSAAIYASRAGLRPLLFEGAVTAENQESGTLPMGQLAMTSEVENYPGFPKGDLTGYLTSALSSERLGMAPETYLEATARCVYGATLVELMRSQAENFGARVVSEDVVSVDFTSRPFALTDSSGRTTRSKTAIIATGASTRWLGLASEDRFKNRGVSACAVCDGASPRFRDRPVLVVGGGDAAVEEALYLSRFASEVWLVHRRSTLRATGVLASRARANPKIRFAFNRVVVEILGDEVNGATGARLASADGSESEPLEISASGVFVAIGRRPNVGFLNGALELTETGCIKRPHPFRTDASVPGVFAAGDVADDRYRQAVVAAGSGACAALDAERFLNEIVGS